MIYSEFKEDEIIVVDLHGYTKDDAYVYLQNVLKTIQPQIKEIIIIHGYKNGNVLMNMVRKEFKNKKVKRKFLSSNPGVTSFILKEN